MSFNYGNMMGLQAHAWEILKENKRLSNSDIDLEISGLGSFLSVMMGSIAFRLDLSDDETMAILVLSLISIMEPVKE